MEIRRCMKCMHEMKPGETVCPECGEVYGSAKVEPFALKPGTILDGKYLVGEMLGQGGFGITYIGFDLLLEQKVAIKEYFPMSTGMVSRENCTSVVWSSTMMEKSGVEKGFDSFLKEARKMAKLGEIPGVVGVKSVFIQNETAYIVMDFIEGETLLKKLEREGPMDFDTCVSLLTPIMEALAEVHQHGIIHRDISPDNIMVKKNGKLILLDLGAAKDLEIQGTDGASQSSQLVAKHGFSPIEQYGRNGNIGPWTDVYAMAATIYFCCTGKLPPAATDRTIEDTLSCQPLLTDGQFNALAAGMAIAPQKRPQDMDALLRMIAPKPKPEPEPSKPRPEPPKPAPPAPRPSVTIHKWLLPVIAGIVVLYVVITSAIGGKSKEKKPDDAARVNTPTAQTTPVTTAPEETVPEKVHVMMAADGEESPWYNRGGTPIWGQTGSEFRRDSIRKITFQGTLEGVPDNAWDVSEAGDRSVLAWKDGGDLYVAADEKIAPNPNASRMFANFVWLTEINFGDCFDTSNVTDMSEMFSGCNNLHNLDISGFDTSSVTDMSYMFSGCNNLTNLDVSGFDTSNVTDMSDMFSACYNLTNLDISGFDTSNVTNMSGMFDSCLKLTSLNLSNINTSNVKDMSSLFGGCDSLTSLDLSGFDTSNVTDMNGMFMSCNSLTSLDLSSFDTSKVTDMSNMFSSDNLTSLNVSGFDTSNVTDMQWMFSGCKSLTSLDVSSFNTSNVTNMHGMFYLCSSLTSLDLSGFDTANVETMNIMFHKCTSLKSLNVLGFNTAKVKSMYAMFADCTSLTSLDISGFDTSKVTDMDHMFSRCSSLTSLDISGFDSESLGDEIISMFLECGNLTDLKCTDKKILDAYHKR